MNRILLSILTVIALVVIADARDLRDARDGKLYKTVKIGNQVWMAENLNYSVKPGTQSWCYDNDESNCSAYGRLYTWAAAVGKSEQQCGSGKECNLRGQVQGVCPAGWHLPSKEEFETLLNAVGDKDWSGKKLKSKSGWNDGGNGTDAFGFAALPAGYRIDSVFFNNEGKYTGFWSTEDSSLSAYGLHLDYYFYKARLVNYLKNYGFSVRCIKNSNEESGISSSSSQIQPEGSNSSGGSNVLIDSRDGKTYKTVMIGNKEWMAENLNYQIGNSWCYENKSANCQKYGRLYTWAAAVGKSEQQCGDGKECKLRGQVQGVCPAGWHLPSKEEFEELRSIAGQKAGDKDRAGIALKSRGGWEDEDVESGNGTDALGFAALPAGYYFSSSDDFNGEGKYAYFWSSSESSSSDAYALYLFYDFKFARVYGSSKHYGLSVRCIKN